MAQQEEERVNGQIVDILERKCAKLSERAEAESQQRSSAEATLVTMQAQLAAVSEELAEVQQRLVESERQVVDLCAAQRDLALDRRTAVQRGAALEEVSSRRDEVQEALRKSEAGAQSLLDESRRKEAEWKEQIVKLVAEAQTARRHTAEHEAELNSARMEVKALTESAQEVVRRYEDESARRLELEERCLVLEEKLRTKEQRTRGEINGAQLKVKQTLQARQHAEELSKQHAERCRQAEARTKELETEVQRLRVLCERGRREAQQLQAAEEPEKALEPPAAPAADAISMSTPAVAPALRSRIPPAPLRPRSGSRPGTASVATPGGLPSATASPTGAGGQFPSATGARCASSAPTAGARSGGACGSDSSASRLRPGAIRRAGSVPARGPLACGPGRAPQSRGPDLRRGSSLECDALSGSAASVASRSAIPSAAVPPQSACSAASRGASDADLDICDAIPSDPEDSSDDEVLSTVQARR